MGVLFVNGIDVKANLWPKGRHLLVLDASTSAPSRARAAILEWRDHESRNEALAMLHRWPSCSSTKRIARRADRGRHLRTSSGSWNAQAARNLARSAHSP